MINRLMYACLWLVLATLPVAAGAQILGKGSAKPVRMIVPAPPGGTTDLLGRVVAERMTELLGQQVIVDNRGGAGGIVGTELVARAPADGHTLGIVYTPHTVLPHLKKSLPYDAISDFSPVSLLTTAPLVLVVHPALPVRTVQDLVTLAKSRPLVYGSAGNGSGGHLSGELLKQMAKIDATHVPYKGAGPAAVDLIAGQLQFQFASQITAQTFMKSGRLRAIAVTGPRRATSLPEVPTVAESGLNGFEFVNWFGMVLPARTPRDTVNRMHAAVVAVMRQAPVTEKLTGLGSDIVAGSPAGFSRFLAADLVKWGKVLRNSGITAE